MGSEMCIRDRWDDGIEKRLRGKRLSVVEQELEGVAFVMFGKVVIGRS